MVKIDFNQDYYADLEVAPSAGIEDIRRSYRKLALKYHPDRNPGGELEAGQRFQIIQAAYEVLTNPEQKQRYDISRRTRYGGASGIRGNPYQDISKNYPPPPRPPGFPTRTNPKRTPGTSTADTYAKFAQGVPHTSPRSSRKPAESTFTWQAWEQMRSGTKGKTSSSQATGGGTSARASSASKTSTSAAPPPVPPRSPQKQATGSFGSRGTRGYTPQSPSGDEPPVASNNYFTTRTHTNLFTETSTFARTRQRDASNFTRTDRDSSNAASPAGFRDSAYADTRQRTPYRTPGGEKLDPFQGANINRSRSTRESTKGAYRDDEDGSPTTSPRQRSSSVPDDPELGPKGKQSVNEAFTTGDSTADAAQDGPSKSAFDGKHPSHQESPDAEGQSTMPDAHGANVSGSAGSNETDTSKLYASQPHFRSGAPTCKAPTREVPQTAQQATGRAGGKRFFEKKTLNLTPELHELLARQSSSEDKPTPGDGLNAFDHKMYNVLSQLSAIKYSTAYGSGKQSGKKSDKQSGSIQRAAHPQKASRQASNANNNDSDSFDFQYPNNSFTPDPQKFTRNSADNINTRFVADESDATNWQFNAGSPVDEAGRPAIPRSKSGSRIGRKTPSFHTQASPAPFAESANGHVPPPNSAFNPEEWSEKIGPQIFQTQGQAQKANTMRTIRNPSKKLKPVRMTAGTAGMVESDENSSGQEDVPQKPPTPADANDLSGTASPNAMDIDSPLEANGVRNIPVEPSRPEWRAGDVKGMKADAKPAAGPQGGIAPPVGGSEDSEEFRATFLDLRNVEPFAQPATGLESFGDMKANLPFPSGASGQVPIQKGLSKPIRLNLPDAPKPPNAPPALAVQGLKPTPAAWKKYMDDFCTYLNEWHTYNTKFSDHFLARSVDMGKKLNDTAWVETRDSSGVQEYVRWAEEDRYTRARWTEECNFHETHVRVFAAHRDRMMK